MVEMDSVPSKTFKTPKILKFNNYKLGFAEILAKFSLNITGISIIFWAIPPAN